MRLVLCSGLIAIAGLAPHPVAGIAGFTVLGAGVSVLQPVILGAVGHSSARRHGPASVVGAVSRFTTVSYAGILAGPVVVGWCAELVGLTWTLAGIGVLPAGGTALAHDRRGGPARAGLTAPGGRRTPVGPPGTGRRMPMGALPDRRMVQLPILRRNFMKPVDLAIRSL